MRLTPPGSDQISTIEPVRMRLEIYPTLRFKLDPTNDWTDELISQLVDTGAVDSLDLKGQYKGTPVDVETDPELYGKLIEAFPEAWLEDPDVSDETKPILDPVADRVTWDARDPLGRRHQVSALDAEDGQHQALAFRAAARALRRRTTTARRTGSAPTAAASGSWGPVAATSSTSPRSSIPDTPNDVAPSGYNTAGTEPGLPSSPLEPMPTDRFDGP